MLIVFFFFILFVYFFFNDTATTEIYTLSLHDALPIYVTGAAGGWYGGHRSFRGVQIICTRVGATADDGLGYINPVNAATAINYAVNMGANVINASWGGSSVSAAAASNAMAAGVTFCHAAGNDNVDINDEIDLTIGVLSVASTGSNSDVKSSFSNFGFWIDVSAPGSNILSTYSDEYTPITASISGTSMASPMVAGLALLIRSQMPSLTKSQVDSIIINSADSLSLYTANPTYASTQKLGSGRIDAFAALSGLANAKFTADVTEGAAPLTVNFTDLSPNSPVGWDWSFGNGDVSTDQNPQYVYNDPGLYDVSLITDENNPLGPGEEHLKRYIWVRQDSLLGDSISASYFSQVVVPIYLNNTTLVKDIQYVFSYGNTFDVTYDSFSVAGTRTDYFENITVNASDPFNKRISIFMQSNTSVGSNYLPPDTGAILNLFFTVGNNGSNGTMILDTTSFNGKSSRITSIYGEYFPAGYRPITMNIGGCCAMRGDVNASGSINVSDLVYLVAYSFQSGPAPACEDEGDVNGSGSINVSDLVYLVAYSFQSGPAPLSCF